MATWNDRLLTAAVAAALATAAVPAAGAATRGTGSAVQQVGSASWAAVATTAGSAPYGSGPLTLPFGAQATQDILFNVVNTGAVTLRGLTYSVSMANVNGNSNVTLFACVGGTFDATAYTCPSPGVLTTIVQSTGPTATAAVTQTGLYPATAGSSIQLLGEYNKSVPPPSNLTGTVGVSVSSDTQVRVGQTTNG